MIPGLALSLFLLVFGLCVVLASRYWVRPNSAVDRVMDCSHPAAPAAGSPTFAFQNFLRWAGQATRGGKTSDELRRDFVQAGMRHSHAEALFRGVQITASVTASLLFAAAAAGQRCEPATILMCGLGGTLGGFLAPREFLRRKVRNRRRAIRKALPNALDLLTVGVEAGLGLDQGIVHVSQQLVRAHPEISEELAMINFETRAGKRRSDALRSLSERTGVLEVKKLAAVLIQADRFGTSVAQSLRAHSDHLRVQARQSAEEKAAKLGVKLVFPIFFFILPSLFVVTVGPVVARIFQDLLPLMNSM